MAQAAALVWKWLPLTLLFVNGYLVFRLFVVTRLTEIFVAFALRRGRGRIVGILFYVIAAAALLSFFIPNAVTVLALLPILKTVDAEIRQRHESIHLTTALTLAVIYGANIGGMGSLIGSPANLVLIGALETFQVPGREGITFFNWFVWAVPLVCFFVLAAWAVVSLLAVPREARRIRLTLDSLGFDGVLDGPQRAGARLFGLFLVFWIGEAIAVGLAPAFEPYAPAVCLAFFALFLYRGFVRRARPDGGPLVRPADIFSGLPRRGLVFLLVLAAVFGGAKLLGLDQHAARLLDALIPPETPLVLVYLALTLTVIFLTEVLSNSVVSLAFFFIAYKAAEAHGMPALGLMMAVSLASTCAFMTPIATPCNALAFGEMKGTSLGRMLALGALLNVVGALLMTVWLRYVIPLVYG